MTADPLFGFAESIPGQVAMPTDQHYVCEQCGHFWSQPSDPDHCENCRHPHPAKSVLAGRNA